MDSCPYCAAPTINSDQTCPNCGANLHGFQLETGATLGKYQIGRVLGQGGFGITYQARDTVLQREVAIKELFPDGSTRKNLGLIPPNSLGVSGFLEAKTRFLTEARTLAQFNHPGIVRVLEVFEANNTAYLVMEALTGETLGAKIAREKKLPEETVKKLALELCDALSVVHKVGLLHRDIKPDNIFLTTDARVVLIDFGSARSFRTSERTQHTQLVTPGYAAPEQYASEAKFGEYTDVYELAATLYHALTGAPPQNATDRLLGSNLIKMPESISSSFATALEQALALKIQDRPQSISIFLSTLNAKKGVKVSRDNLSSTPISTQNISPDISIRGEILLAHKVTYLLRLYAGVRVDSVENHTFNNSLSSKVVFFGVIAFSAATIPFAINSIISGYTIALILFPIAGIVLYFTFREQDSISKNPPKKEFLFYILLVGNGLSSTDHTFHVAKTQQEADHIVNNISQAMQSLGIV